ncbi:MAG: AI-2E family transporter [Clostridia bacterium]|nr:AI-2E family transporter [Clostridia bacterium]
MKSPIPEDLRGKTISNIIVVCVGIVVAAAVLHIGQLWRIVRMVTHAAMPIFIGFAIAFILLPAVNRVESFFAKLIFRRKPHPKLSRILAIVIAYLLMLALLSGFFAILVPQVISSLKSVVIIITNALPGSMQELRDMLERSAFLQRLGLDSEQVLAVFDDMISQLSAHLSQLSTYTSLLINNLLAIASSISSSIYSVLFHALVGLIASIYMLMDRERFCAQAKKICYAIMKRPTCETLIYWTRRASDIFAGFITGKILDSLIIGVICYVCMLLFSIEYPLLISVIVGVTNVIPFFGPYIGAIPSILFLLLVNPLSALWFGIFILLLQQIDGNIIGPLVLGDHVGLSAFWIMLSITVGGGLFGFAGMLLSVPTFALIYAIARTIIDQRLRARGLPAETDSYISAPEALPKEKEA